MEEWKEIHLRDVVELKNGFAFKSKDFSESGVPVIKIKNVKPNNIVLDTLSYVSAEIAADKSQYLISPNDILITMSGNRADGSPDSWVGKAALFKKTGSYLLNQRVSIIRSNSSRADQTFLAYLLSSWHSQVHFINNANSSGGQANISPDIVKDLEILLPPLPEQRAIASVLSSLDDKIDLLHRQNQSLEQMAETLFRQWFVEEADEGWEEKLLSEFIDVKHGYAFKGQFISSEETNLILVTPGNFKIGGGFKSDKFKYYTQDNFPVDYLFEPSDLIVTMTDLSVNGDTLGYAALVPASFKHEKYLHNQRVGKVQFKKNIGKYFVYYLLRTEDYQWFILSGASGTSIRHTSPSSIRSYPFKCPPSVRVNEFERICIDFHKKIEMNQIQIQTLTTLRDTLLPKLMSGEVRVHEITKTIKTA